MQKIYITIIKWGAYLVMLSPLVVFRWVLYPHGFGKALYLQILVEIMLFFYILLVLQNKKYLPNIKNKLNIAVFSFIGLLTISTFFSADPYRSFWGTQSWNNGLIVILHAFALFMVMTNVLLKKSDWMRLLKISTVVASFVLLYALGQKMGLSFLLQAGAERLTATTGNPVYFSSYLLFAILLSGFLAFYSYKKNQLWFYFSSITSMLGVLCFFFTKTRGGFLGITAGIIIMIFFYFICFKDKKIRLVASTLLIALIIAGAGASIYLLQTGKILDLFERSNTVKTRVISWTIAWEGFKAKPIFGWGLENFNMPFEKYFKGEFYEQGLGGKALEYAVEFPHNKILEIAVSNGLFVLLSYLAMIATAFILIFKTIVKTKEKKYLLILGLLTAYFTFNMFVFDSIMSFIFFYFLLSFIYFLYTNLKTTPEELEPESIPVKNTYLKNAVEIIALIIFISSLYLVNFKPASASHTAQSARRKFLAKYDQVYIEEAKQFNKKNTFINEKINIELAKLTIKRFINKSPQGAAEKNSVLFIIDKLEEEVEKHPNRFLSYQLLGRLYNIAGSFDASYLNMSIPLMNELIAKGSKRVEVHHILGTAYLKKGKNSDAIKHFQKAITINPEYHDPYVVMAKVYLYLKDYTQSLSYFDKALDMGYKKRADLMLFGDVYTEYENKEQAKRIYNILLKDNPNDSQVKSKLDALESEIK